MPSANRPSVRFRRIGRALRQARENSGLTIETAARRFGRSPGWLSTAENGLRPIRTDDLSDLLEMYGITTGPLRKSLLSLAARGRRKNWERSYEGNVSPAALDLASLEGDAASIRTFQPNLIPGLMQTEDYARAVIETGLPIATRDIAALVAFRLARQSVLAREDPPTYCAIVGESALHQRVGSDVVRRAQLTRLIETAQLEHVALHVLPFEAGAHLWMGVPFDLLALRPPGQLTVAVVSHGIQSSFVEDEREVEAHEEIFNYLLEATLDRSDSLNLVERLVSQA